MRIVKDYPPMIDEIDAAFNVRGKGIIFAWGDTIFNPAWHDIPPSLIAHEQVHGRRQGADVRGWWLKYIDDPQFRLEEEIHAHRAEYQHIARNGNRPERRRGLKLIASRLSSPLYGKMITLKQAKEILLKP